MIWCNLYNCEMANRQTQGWKIMILVDDQFICAQKATLIFAGVRQIDHRVLYHLEFESQLRDFHISSLAKSQCFFLQHTSFYHYSRTDFNKWRLKKTLSGWRRKNTSLQEVLNYLHKSCSNKGYSCCNWGKYALCY